MASPGRNRSREGVTGWKTETAHRGDVVMGKTLAEKVWDAHVVRRVEGEPDLLYIDLHLVHEVTSPQAFDGLRASGRPVRRTSRRPALSAGREVRLRGPTPCPGGRAVAVSAISRSVTPDPLRACRRQASRRRVPARSEPCLAAGRTTLQHRRRISLWRESLCSQRRIRCMVKGDGSTQDPAHRR